MLGPIQLCRWGQGGNPAPIWPHRERGGIAQHQSSCGEKGQGPATIQLQAGREHSLAPQGEEDTAWLQPAMQGLWFGNLEQGRVALLTVNAPQHQIFQPMDSPMG